MGVRTTVVATVAAIEHRTNDRIQAKIPFEFTIGDKTFPSDEYIFDLAGSQQPHVLSIRAKNSGERTMFDTEQIPGIENPRGIDLVFDRVGDKTYLMEVWGVTDSGRGVKHVVDGQVVKRASDASRQHIRAVRVVDPHEKDGG
jgi:hypothetical protein